MERHIHRLIILLCAVVFLASLYGLRRLSRDDYGSGGVVTRSIASAETVENEVKRKPMGSFSWYGVAQGADLGYRDTIFVGPAGYTVLALDDGTKLTVSENSLVVLDINKRSLDGQSNVTEIRLVRGDMAVQPSAHSSEVKVLVGKDTSIGVKAGSSVAVGKTNKGVDLVVKKGQVKLFKKTALKTEEFDFKPTSSSRIKSLDLDADTAEINKKITEQEQVHDDGRSDSKSLLNLVPKKEDLNSGVETLGELERFAKEVNLKDGREIASVPPIEVPVVVEPPKVEEPPQPEHLRFLDLTKKYGWLDLELPENLDPDSKYTIEMSFQEDFAEKFLRLPLDRRTNEKTYSIDISYFLDVPGFRKRASKYPRLYWQLVSQSGEVIPAKWAVLRKSHSTALKFKPGLDYTMVNGETALDISWGFKGLFIERFNITLASDGKYENVLCRLSIPNQNFVDAKALDREEKDLRSFTYSVGPSDKCGLNSLAEKKQKFYVRVEPVNTEGKIIKPAGTPYQSVIYPR